MATGRAERIFGSLGPDEIATLLARLWAIIADIKLANWQREELEQALAFHGAVGSPLVELFMHIRDGMVEEAQILDAFKRTLGGRLRQWRRAYTECVCRCGGGLCERRTTVFVA